MIARVFPSSLEGEIEAPASKSITHRAIICASLSDEPSTIRNWLDADDTRRTLIGCAHFGAVLLSVASELRIVGVKRPRAPLATIDCGESGATLRFLLPLAAACEGRVEFKLGKRLKERPTQPLTEVLSKLGAKVERKLDSLVVMGAGKLKGGAINIRGDLSSQFISGLLFLAPLTEEGIKLRVTRKLVSKPYVELTLSVLKDFGIVARTEDNLRWIEVEGQQDYKGCDYVVEGDYSSAAFLLAAGAIAGRVRVCGLNPKSAQGDKKILEILERMGCELRRGENCIEVERSELKAVGMDASDVPDLVPVCAALACYAEGETKLSSVGRLELKESERLTAIVSELSKLGAKVERRKDELLIKGPVELQGGVVDSHNDHRIAMMLAIAALGARGPVEIRGAEAVSKSYPSFFEDLGKLGTKLELR